MKKIIGITANIVTTGNAPYFDGSKRIRIYSDYVDSVINAGAIPFIIPVTTNKEVLDANIDMLDGLIITGGYDINPLRYGEDPHEKLQEISYERDEYEFYLFEKAIEKKKPVFGICRGHQLINVASGGTLYQDVSLVEGNYIKHNQQALCNHPTHKIEIEEGSMLSEVLGLEAVVNSFHHLAVKKVAENFKISAKSKDGIIEAIEKDGEPFVMGVQWHPETLTKTRKDMLDLFSYFISKI